MGGYSVGAVATSLFFARQSLWGGTPPLSVKVTKDGSFLTEWKVHQETGTPPCSFFNATYQYTAGLCSHFALARMSAATQNEAIDRALTCAAHYETDCVISPEVGLSVPAAFVYDQMDGLKMVIAPKIVPLTHDHNSTVKLVGLQDPHEKLPNVQIHFNDTINVEYLKGGTRRMTTEIMDGPAAYCVQLLRLAFDPACWGEID